ncbi:hypothetical protein I7I51_03892 [Histoplasma capsulatum]|uniref:Uncharacterized protein n=1 Tax=Ajellomyces capsulatus TaxID=5037 RepID=A0A8A1M7P0_AJECA|nr:hypothetical protein I7I51_03892 [Histoplasma capsulatum]
MLGPSPPCLGQSGPECAGRAVEAPYQCMTTHRDHAYLTLWPLADSWSGLSDANSTQPRLLEFVHGLDKLHEDKPNNRGRANNEQQLKVRGKVAMLLDQQIELSLEST